MVTRKMTLGIALLGAPLFFCVRTSQLKAPEDSWLLTATNPNYQLGTYLGNGYFSVTIPPEGTGWTSVKSPSSYISGVYNGALLDPPHHVDLPNWSAIVLSVDGKEYSREVGSLRDYQQILDMKRGLVTTRETWEANGKVVELTATIFVSRNRMHLACIQYQMRPRQACRLGLRTFLDARQNKDLTKLEAKGEEQARQIWLVTETLKPEVETVPKTKIAQVIGWDFSPNVKPRVTVSTADGYPQLMLTIDAKAGESYTLFQYVGICTSLEDANPLTVAQKTISVADRDGYKILLQEHTEAWAKLWESDIVVQGDTDLQKVIHASLFYLLESLREGRYFSIAPMGLSSNSYNGHIFWDAETWMYPPMLLLHPELAKSVVEYRYRTLDGARLKAKENGCRGAMFAWESSFTGCETTPTWAATGQYEQHITGDVALAQWQYYCVTHDQNWLREHGFGVIKETAEFWASRVVYNPEQDRYQIHEVIPPDEYHERVNNSVYTNFIAKRNLELAVHASELLGIDYPQEWKTIAEKMYLPFDPAQQMHLEFEGYKGDKIKQADVVMLAYPLEMPMSDTVRANDLHYYAARTDSNGPAMTHSIHTVVAAQIGDRTGVERYFRDSYIHNVNPPFYCWSESPGTAAINFHTGAGGFLQGLLNGLVGIRIREHGLVVNPLLPTTIAAVRIQGLHLGGAVFDLTVTQGEKISVRKIRGKTEMDIFDREERSLLRK